MGKRKPPPDLIEITVKLVSAIVGSHLEGAHMNFLSVSESMVRCRTLFLTSVYMYTYMYILYIPLIWVNNCLCWVRLVL